ncbi:hypothetical protein RQP46_006864 [Phenoliferia psychrophenolica]
MTTGLCRMLVVGVTLLASLASAQLLFPANQIPFAPDHDHDHDLSHLLLPGGAGPLWSSPRPPKIAIIGAGAGGSSAAFFLHHFRRLEKEGLESDVVIFESSDYVGGRSTVVWPWHDDPTATPTPADDEDDQPVELGASIFIQGNKNLAKAARVFNLSLVSNPGEEGGMTIWDGEQFVYTESKGWGWGYWDIAKMFWRYGRSPLWVRTLVQATVADFTSLYTSKFVSSGAFSSLASFADATNLSEAASMSALEYFTKNSISPLFTTELIAAGATVNYGTPVSRIHGVGALVSLAATGAVAVKGGNRRIFQEFVKRSGAKVHLGAKQRVTEIVKLDSMKGERAQWVVRTAAGGETFDAVILASPFHLSSLKILNSPTASLIPPQPYVTLHVSFIITNSSSPLPSYFSPSSTSTTTIPKAVFSTFDTTSQVKPKFNSLNYLKTLSEAQGAGFGEGEWHVVKMFSRGRMEDREVGRIFGEKNVGKVWRKIWSAYPKLDPIKSARDFAPVRPDEGFYYVNGFERLISTMETETISAFNVVSLLLNDLYGYTPPTSWAEWEEEKED